MQVPFHFFPGPGGQLYMTPYGLAHPPPWYPPYGMPPQTPQAVFGSPERRTPKRELPSSPPDTTGFEEPFPKIEAFLNNLTSEYPKRKLNNFADIFTENDFYTIDDLEGIAAQCFTAPPFGMTEGNADFLVKQLDKAIKRVKRIREKERIEAKRARQT